MHLVDFYYENISQCKLSYMFRRLLRHLQGELYSVLRTIVILFEYKF